MAVVDQKPKEKIDVGTIGDPSTGDILYDGGGKINSNFNALYNAFGDTRLFKNSTEGNGLMRIHATGYWQKVEASEINNKVVDMGGQYDVNTTVQQIWAYLPTGKLGESVSFCNTNGSWATNAFTVRPQSGEGINGSFGDLKLEQPNIRIIFTCISDISGSVNWTYRIESLYGDNTVPVNEKFEVTKAVSIKKTLFKRNLYNAVKLIAYAQETGVSNPEKTTSEILILVDDADIYSDEYSILFKTKKAYTIRFYVDTQLSDFVTIEVISNVDKLLFTIKSIETIKV